MIRKLKFVGAAFSFAAFTAGWGYVLLLPDVDRNWEERNFDNGIFLWCSVCGIIGLIFLSSLLFFPRPHEATESELSDRKRTRVSRVLMMLILGGIVGYSVFLGLMMDMLNRHGI